MERIFHLTLNKQIFNFWKWTRITTRYSVFGDDTDDETEAAVPWDQHCLPSITIMIMSMIK